MLVQGRLSLKVSGSLEITLLFKEEKSPDPGTYQLPSDFDKPSEAAKKGKMYSFGAGREAYDRVYYKERIPHDR